MGLGRAKVASLPDIESTNALRNSYFNSSSTGILFSEIIRFFTFASLEQCIMKYLRADRDPRRGAPIEYIAFWKERTQRCAC